MDAVYMNSKNITGDVENDAQEEAYPHRLEAFEAPMRVFLIILFTATSILSLIGNIVVIIVERYGERSAKNMRKFLTNLAVSDIIFGVVCVPFTYTHFLFGQWILPSWMCPLSQLIQVLSVGVTTFTLTVIAIERYLVVTHPLSHKIQCLTKRCNIMMATAWLFGICVSIYPTMNMATVEFVWENQTHMDCRSKSGNTNAMQLFSISAFSVNFVIPLLIQTYCYASIGKRITKRTIITEERLQRSSSVDEERDRTIIMMIVVVIAFTVCWLPIKTFMLLLYVWPKMSELSDDFSYYRYVGTYFFCHWLAASNSFVNPIIYSFISKSFRRDLMDIIFRVQSYLTIKTPLIPLKLKSSNSPISPI